MSNVEPYTNAELTDDNQQWSRATLEQKAAAFAQLMAAASAIAFNRQSRVLIETLREIRAQRDGVQP